MWRSSRGWVDADVVSCRQKQDDMFDMFSNTLTLPTFEKMGTCRRRETEIKHGRVAMFATLGQKLKQGPLHSWRRR